MHRKPRRVGKRNYISEQGIWDLAKPTRDSSNFSIYVRYSYIFCLRITSRMPETAVSPSTGNRPRKQYRCSLCDKPFDSAETLDSHQKFEHSEPGHRKPVAGVG